MVDTSEETISTDVFSEALSALDICEIMTGEIPNLLVAPYWSKKKKYHDLMIQKASSKLANKWNIAPVCDITADSSVANIAAAIVKKTEDGYNSHL